MPAPPALPRVRARRVRAAIKAGSSLPMIVDDDAGGAWVVKWHGAGDGPRGLARELLASALALQAGLRVPPLALVALDPTAADLVIDVRDEEATDLLRASPGDNLGSAFLPAARPLLPARDPLPAGELAARILAFDVFVMNVDRRAQNPNLLLDGAEVVCIDQAAVLLPERRPGDAALATGAPWVRGHLLARQPADLAAGLAELRGRLDLAAAAAALALVPDDWLAGFGAAAPAARARLAAVLAARIAAWDTWSADALAAWNALRV